MICQVNFHFWTASRRGLIFLFLETNLLPGDGRYQTLDLLGVVGIDMIDIDRSSTSVLSITDYDLHTM